LLLSMTGFGEARIEKDDLAVLVEARTVNSRFFKLVVRINEGYGSLEPKIEALVRPQVRRGTVQVNVFVDRVKRAEDFRINTEVLSQYRRQLEALWREWEPSGDVPAEALLALPGVVEEGGPLRRDAEGEWPVIARAVEQALESLCQMRIAEGRAMAEDLRANCRAALEAVEQVAQRAPEVANAYRSRLEERMKKLLAEFQVSLNAGDLLREVGLFAERVDISEEIVRLRSHLQQFESTLDCEQSSGRKLEFLIQEMFREANTIGSKAGDVEISRLVIDMKAAIERMREMVQNAE